jgi:hypothetical protein
MPPLKFTPALMTSKANLHVEAACGARLCSCRDNEIDAEVWRQTEERDEDWLVGPLRAQDVPLNAAASRRLGLRLHHKIRLIDVRAFCAETGTWDFFQAQVLPLAAVKSVHSSLHWLG